MLFINIKRSQRAALWPTSARILSLFFLGLFIVALSFQIVGLPRFEIYRGPFLQDTTSDSRAFLLPLGNRLLRNCCLNSGGDDNEQPLGSQLRLWINGVEMGPAHAPHPEIREGHTTAFSHVSNYIVFSMPAGVENTNTTEATVSYKWRPRAIILAFLPLTSALLALIGFSKFYAAKTQGFIARNCGTIARVLFWLLLVGILTCFLLAAFGWRQEEIRSGPFVRELVADSQAFLLPLGNRLLRNCCINSGGDDNEEPSRSQLQLRINGVEMGPAHAGHPKIRAGGTTAYSHWTNYVLFSLPPGVENTTEVQANLKYEWRPRTAVLLLFVLASILMGFIGYRPIVERYIQVNGRRAGRFLFWLLCAGTLGCLMFKGFGWPQQEMRAGPFASETAISSQAFLLPLGKPLLRDCCLDSGGDNNEKPTRSHLRLWINGIEMGPAHAPHPDIRAGGTIGFSHWTNHILFSLPPSAENTPEVQAIIKYEWRPRTTVLVLVVIATVVLGLLFYWGTVIDLLQMSVVIFGRARSKGQRVAADFWKRWGGAIAYALARAPYGLLYVLGIVTLSGSATYLICTAYAFATGWALPGTAFVRWSSVGYWAAESEPYLGHLLLACAGVGTIVAWITRALPCAAQDAANRDEVAIGKLFPRCLFLIVVSALVLSASAMRAGLVRPGDLQFASMGGLIAFSDAGGYISGAYDQATHGDWNVISIRRPFAAAFRSVLLFFGGFSIPNMLLIQETLLALALCYAAAAVARWRGLWVGLAFAGFAYTYVRTFGPTPLTEPLGLCWALLSVPFLIAALETRALTYALLTLAMTTLALMTRMGSMFWIPALFLWIFWYFGRVVKQRLIAGASALVVLLSLFATNILLQRLYGGSDQETGSNFSYTLCGLTLGTTWDGCLHKLAEQGIKLPPNEAAATKIVYQMAGENLKKDPAVFFHRLVAGVQSFGQGLTNWLWTGYLGKQPAWGPRMWLLPIMTLGLLYAMLAQRRRGELEFWLLFWLSLVASASIVIFDDGWRVLTVSHPLVALFFALGMSGPVLPLRAGQLGRSVTAKVGGTILAIAVALFFAVPWAAHRVAGLEHLSERPSFAQEPDVAIVAGGRRMTGFLVVADDAPLRADIPTLHLSDFIKLVQDSSVEHYQGLVNPVAPEVPFGFVFTPRLEKQVSSEYRYIVPAFVMEQRDVAIWRFKTEHWQTKPQDLPGYGADYWFYVTHAEQLH
jgi:hypothetical protein